MRSSFYQQNTPPLPPYYQFNDAIHTFFSNPSFPHPHSHSHYLLPYSSPPSHLHSTFISSSYPPHPLFPSSSSFSSSPVLHSVKMLKTAFVIFCLVILFENSIGPLSTPLSTPSSSLGYSRSLSMLSLPKRPKPHAFLKLTRSQIAPFKAKQHSLSSKTTHQNRIVMAQAKKSDGSGGHSENNKFLQSKGEIIKEFLAAKAKNLTIKPLNPEYIEACLLELLMTMVQLHVGQKIIHNGILYSNTGKETQREFFALNLHFQEEALTPLGLKIIEKADIRLIGIILGLWIMPKRTPKVGYTGEEEDHPIIELDHHRDDFFNLLKSSEDMGKKLAQKMDAEIERLKPTLNSENEENGIEEHPAAEGAPNYDNVNKLHFDLGLFGWTLMAFGEHNVQDAIRLILLLRMLLDNQLTGKGLWDYLEGNCVPAFRDIEKQFDYMEVLEARAARLRWFNNEEEYSDGRKKKVFYFHDPTFQLNNKDLTTCESFEDDMDKVD